MTSYSLKEHCETEGSLVCFLVCFLGVGGGAWGCSLINKIRF